ncbi:response regulator transcription factor [Streptomyces sp. CSDS2]|uniref:helix-turn-helix transcriptional regulator n=1 Tax=Streptomyces sp. CSDS2 TaxID=3055051 RepID=UPI0025B084A1|nr:response regulator transcription factor [Streptomyces sp. CSDS2]MDN3259827.1 response regulator transcription factor [Streptomyces sp. CSDS2]
MRNAMLLTESSAVETKGALRGILVALSSEVIRRGICNMLERLDPPRHIEPHSDVAAAAQALRGGSYSLVIVDAAADSEETLLRFTKDASELGAKVLILLDRADADTVERITTLPADGFLVQSDLTLECMSETLERLDRGDLPIPATMVRQLMARARHGSAAQRTPVQLTPREQDVLHLMGEGLSNKQIAKRFGISVHGVKRHVTNVLAKLNCPNRTQAVSVALKQGLLGHAA